jgi:protoheme ferro-lyase
MLRTSRCIAGILFQLGGPDALQAVERFLHLYLGDFSFSRNIRHLSEKLFVIAIARRSQPPARTLLFHAIGKLGPSAHNLRGEVAACCVAVG